jgi:hypothetical protein
VSPSARRRAIGARYKASADRIGVVICGSFDSELRIRVVPEPARGKDGFELPVRGPLARERLPVVDGMTDAEIEANVRTAAAAIAARLRASAAEIEERLR